MNPEFTKKIGRLIASIGVALLPSVIPVNVYSEGCPIPSTPQNLKVDVEPPQADPSGGRIPMKEPLRMAIAAWDPVPGADRYNFRSTRIDPQTNQRPTDKIVDNWPGTVIETSLLYPLANPQWYAAWVHAGNACGFSQALGIDFETTRSNNDPNLKLSPISS